MKRGKTMKVTMGFLILLMAWSFNCPAFVNAGEDGLGGRKSRILKKRPRLGSREVLKRLDLTKEQSKALREHRAQLRKKLAEINGQIRIHKAELQNEMEKPEPDKAKLDLLSKKISDLSGQKMSAKIQANLEAEKILSPDQSEKWKSLQQEESDSRDAEP